MKLFVSIVTGLVVVASSLIADSPKYDRSTGNACYKGRDVMYPLEETFDGLKQTLMQSNLNIVTVTKEDGVLTAKGSQINDDEDTVMTITLTADFKSRGEELTSVKIIASYETNEKENTIGQIGAAGVTLPIPVPFTGKYALVGQGTIEDPLWYSGFYNSLNKILFENHMKYAK